jgi:UDP-3-O-[3-hydroxymyristoyl] glucosamine N-acyltransferase
MTESAGGALRVADVAAAVGGAVQGDPEHRVSGIAPLDRAGPTDLTFLASAKYARLLATCGAGAVLVTPELAETPGPCANRIVVAKPHDAMLQILPRLYRAPERPFIGVHATAVVDPSAQVDADVCVEAFAVIGRGARVGKGSWIGSHTVIGDGVELGSATHLFPHVTLYSGTRVGSRVAIHAGTRIGSDGFGYVYANGAHQKVPHVGGCVIGNDVEIGANCTIDRGSIDLTMIGDGTKIDNLVHVAHNVRIGRLCLLAAQVGIAGSVRIEDGAVLGGQVGVSGHLTIGSRATLAAQAGVISDVPAGELWSGYPARPHKQSLRGSAAVAKLPDLLKRINELLDREEKA